MRSSFRCPAAFVLSELGAPTKRRRCWGTLHLKPRTPPLPRAASCCTVQNKDPVPDSSTTASRILLYGAEQGLRPADAPRAMEGSSSRSPATRDGLPAKRVSGGEAESDRDIKTHFRVCRFMMETGVKLGMRSVPVATACVLYHRFFERVSAHAYEPYLVAMSCVYLAGKVEEQHTRTRDIINVSHRYFNSGSAPLDCDKEFWDSRDSVVQCELLILRQLNFQVSFEHPHKYLLHYLLSVKSLVNRHAWSRTPVAETSWALLRDCYHGAMCIRHLPQHIAIATLHLALNSYGVELPVGEKEWWQVLCVGVTKAHIDAVVSDLLQLYDMEAKCI